MNFDSGAPMANTASLQATTSPAPARPRRTAGKALPQYMFLRGGTYYFKRKVPVGLEHAFPQASGAREHARRYRDTLVERHLGRHGCQPDWVSFNPVSFRAGRAD